MLNILRQNLSFFVLALSSFSFFILNIILKDNLSPDDYGLFSIFISYISLLSSFGMFGFEQTLLRTSKIKSKLEIEKEIILPALLSIFLSSIIGTFLMLSNYDINMSFLLFCLLSFIVITTKLLYNLFRLLSSYILSQITLNFWKILLTIIICSTYVIHYKFTIDFIFNTVLLLFAISLLFAFFLYKKIDLTNTIKTTLLLKKSFLFFIALLTISLLGYGDRFFIESRFGLATLGDYFFYLNVFLFPFSLFQTYIGFKEIVTFKKSYSISILNKKISSVFKYSFFFSCVLFFVIYMVEFLGFYKMNIFSNLEIILPLILLGNIKILYSLLSSAIGAISDDIMLLKVNLKSIISLLIICPLIYFYSFNLLLTIIFIIILWVFRCIIWYYQLIKQTQ